MEKEIIQKAGRYFSIAERHELIKTYLSSGGSRGQFGRNTLV